MGKIKEIKPCPFCGEDGFEIIKGRCVRCDFCGMWWRRSYLLLEYTWKKKEQIFNHAWFVLACFCFINHNFIGMGGLRMITYPCSCGHSAYLAPFAVANNEIYFWLCTKCGRRVGPFATEREARAEIKKEKQWLKQKSNGQIISLIRESQFILGHNNKGKRWRWGENV